MWIDYSLFSSISNCFTDPKIIWFAFCSLAKKPCAMYNCFRSSKAVVTQQRLAELLQLAVGSTAQGRGDREGTWGSRCAWKTLRGHAGQGFLLWSPPAHFLLPASAAASPFPCSAGCQPAIWSNPKSFLPLGTCPSLPPSHPVAPNQALLLLACRGGRGRQGATLRDQ